MAVYHHEYLPVSARVVSHFVPMVGMSRIKTRTVTERMAKSCIGLAVPFLETHQKKHCRDIFSTRDDPSFRLHGKFAAPCQNSQNLLCDGERFLLTWVSFE